MYGADYDNPWLRDVETAARRAPAALTVLGAAAFAFLVLWPLGRWGGVIMTSLRTSMVGVPEHLSELMAGAALQLLAFGPLMLAATFAAAVEGRSAWRLGDHPFRALAVGLVLGGAGYGVSVGFVFAAGAVQHQTSLIASPSLAGVLIGICLVAFQSGAEEVFFRGWLQPLLCARWGPWFGLTATAALFGALHLIAGVHGPLAVANVFLAGLFFGLLALRSGGILAPVAAHFAWNWTESGIFGLAPGPADSLFHLHLGGSRLWSGGADAMDGSLGATLVLLVLDASLIALGPSRPAPPSERRSGHAPYQRP